MAMVPRAFAAQDLCQNECCQNLTAPDRPHTFRDWGIEGPPRYCRGLPLCKEKPVVGLPHCLDNEPSCPDAHGGSIGRQQVDPSPPFPFFVEPLPPAPVCG